jgi:hypothetical protein
MSNQIDLESVAYLAKSARPGQLIPLWRRMIVAEMNEVLPETRIRARLVLDIIEDAWALETTALHRSNNDWKIQEYQKFPGFENIKMWKIEGPLKAIGYSVSVDDNLPLVLRQALLFRLFDGPIPPIFEARYLGEWGRARSPVRLQKIGDALCTFGMLRAKLLPNGKVESAYQKWKADYDYLETIHRKHQFSFSWRHFPRTRA